MFASRYSALHALSIVVAASLAWVMPALAFLGYNQTFHTDAELYLRIGMAIICVVWMVVCMQDLDGPLAGLAEFFSSCGASSLLSFCFSERSLLL